MKVYCQQCGAKIEFSVSSKPKFCQGCGTALSLGSNRTAAITEDIHEEEDDVRVTPSISGLEFEIETYTKQAAKLGEVIGTSKGLPPASGPRTLNKNLSKEEFRKQFQKEAGSLRSGNPIQTDEKE